MAGRMCYNAQTMVAAKGIITSNPGIQAELHGKQTLDHGATCPDAVQKKGLARAI